MFRAEITAFSSSELVPTLKFRLVLQLNFVQSEVVFRGTQAQNLESQLN